MHVHMGLLHSLNESADQGINTHPPCTAVLRVQRITGDVKALC